MFPMFGHGILKAYLEITNSQTERQIKIIALSIRRQVENSFCSLLKPQDILNPSN